MVFSFTGVELLFHILGHLPSNISSMTRSYPAEVRCVSGATPALCASRIMVDGTSFALVPSVFNRSAAILTSATRPNYFALDATFTLHPNILSIGLPESNAKPTFITM